MRHYFTTAILLMLVVQTFAQHTIKGKVTDENGNALEGATVAIQNSTVGKITDKNGVFLFDGLTKTHYPLKASYIGYETTVLQADADREIIIIMKSKSVSINEITVTSLRANEKSPIAYTNIDKGSISKNNLGQDIPYLLLSTPSLVITSDAGTGIGYTGFRIRGTDASRINVTINGVPYNDADEQGAYWVDVPDLASSVENIQIQRGVGTTTNGAAAFGANINIQTNNFESTQSIELSATFGSFNTQKATLKYSSGIHKNHLAVDARLSSITSDGYIDRGTTDMKSYLLQAGYYGEKNTLKFITFGGLEKTYHAWNGVPKDSLKTNRTYNSCGYMGTDANGKPLFYKDQTDNYLQTNYQLVSIHTFNPMLSMNATLHYTRGDGYYEEYKQDQSFVKYSIPDYSSSGTIVQSSDLVRQKKMGNDFAGMVFSLNYSKNKLSAQMGGAINRYWGNHFGDVTWIKNYPSAIFPKEYYRSKVSKWDGNIYLKANYEVVKNLFLNGELQYRRVDYSIIGKNDKWDFNNGTMQNLNIKALFNFFNPKAGLLYRINEKNECFASYAVANREPTRTNFTDASADNDLPTYETLYDSELGYKFHNNILSVGVNAFYMSYHNQLVLTGKLNEIGEPLSENVLSSYRAGIELIGSARLSNNFRWDGSVTFSKNRINNFDEYVDVYDQNWEWTGQQKNHIGNTNIAYSPSVTWNNAFTINYGKFEAKWTEQYVGKQYIDNTSSNDRSLDAYFVSNLRLSYSVKLKKLKALNLYLVVNNINDAKYISNGWSYSYYLMDGNNTKQRYNDLGFYPQAGINLLGGFTLKF